MKLSGPALVLIGVGIIAVILVILAAWFVFLRGEQNALSAFISGRGFNESVPAFDGSEGSTSQNIRQGLAERFGLTSSLDENEGGFGANGGLSQDPATNFAKFETPKFWQLTGGVPVAGFDVRGEGTEFHVLYMEIPTGHIFSLNPFSGDVTRVTNTLIPKTHAAGWAGEDKVIIQHFDETYARTTFTASIMAATSSSGTGSLDGNYLKENVISFATQESVDDVFYLIETPTGSRGFIQSFDEDDNIQNTRVFTSAIQGWNTLWKDQDTLILTQRAANGVPGSAYALSTDGTRSPIITGVPGLSLTIDSASNRILFSESSGDSHTLYYREDSSDTPRKLPLSTLAQKCVFDPRETDFVYCGAPVDPIEGLVPDEWYRGEMHFSDALWKINVETGSVENILSPGTEHNSALDVGSIQMNNNGTHLFFTDTMSNIVWGLRVRDNLFDLASVSPDALEEDNEEN